MNTKRLLWIAAAIFLVSGTASAALVLTLDDPSTSEIDLRIEDQDSNDTSQFPGVVGVSSTTIGGVPVSEVTAISKPAEGSVSSPSLSLTFQSGVSTEGGLLSISVTDTDFSANLPYKASATGGTGGTFQFDFFGDSNNTEFGKSFDIGSSDILTGNPIDTQSFQSAANPVGSLTISADIGFTGSFQTGGFDSKIEAEAVQLIDVDEIIGTWDSGIWYWDVAASKWTNMTPDSTNGDIAAGDFTGDGKADVASIWDNGLWYQDGVTLDWTKVSGSGAVYLTAGDVTGDGRSEIISTWSNGIWYYNVAISKWTKMTASNPTGEITAGDFTGDGKADVASIWDNGLWYQDGATLDWTKVSGSGAVYLTAGDVTGDGRSEIISTWSNGIWYYNVAISKWTKMTASNPTGEITAGDFTGDGKADVASIWSNGPWYQDGDTLDWFKIDDRPPLRVTAGDVTGN